LAQEIVHNLLKFIVGYATQNEISLTTVRLVKFLYLADLYYARAHEGKTLSKFPWAFVYYGPYCSEAVNAIQQAESAGIICMKSFESKFSEDEMYQLFYCKDDYELDEIQRDIPGEIVTSLMAAIKKYGDDTPYLLDHVYFETEPMKEARKGDVLDFSKAKPPIPSKPVFLKAIPKKKIELARRYVKALGEKFEHNRMRLEKDKSESIKLKDAVYYQALEIMDEEDLEVGMKGTAKIET
jgi:uncharacterized phage-associated protein